MWTSMLGSRFPREQIEGLDKEHGKVLQALRNEPANARCAECCESGTSWASVSLGIFLCTRCADVHRALGTHISKIKGCGGMDLWGPDEISRMREVGNAVAEATYKKLQPEPDAPKEKRIELCMKKYAVSLLDRPATTTQSQPTTPTKAATVPGAALGATKATTPSKRCPPNPLHDSSDEDLFKDFGIPQSLSPVDVLKRSQWWGGAPEKVMAREASLSESTVASSEAGSAAPSPAKVVATRRPSFTGNTLQDNDQIWDDFGDW